MPFEKLITQIVQAPHQLYFPEQFDNFIFHCCLTFHYLERHHAPGPPALRLRHASIGAVANQLQYFIFLVYCTTQFMCNSEFIFCCVVFYFFCFDLILDFDSWVTHAVKISIPFELFLLNFLGGYVCRCVGHPNVFDLFFIILAHEALIFAQLPRTFLFASAHSSVRRTHAQSIIFVIFDLRAVRIIILHIHTILLRVHKRLPSLLG